MKLKFKIQPYQTSAVKSVVDCFTGQVKSTGIKYTIDAGLSRNASGQVQEQISGLEGFVNADVQLPDFQLLHNIQAVQRRQNLPLSEKLVTSAGCKINLDVEMETGTGKTYCYIKTIFELNENYGWSKFIVIVPSIAIREGVFKSLEITADHFAESYGKKARFFIYNSRQLHHLESFSSDAGINVMVINIQAFNATGKDNRRIYDELDDFQSRRPIDVISKNRPILILDEPQKMEGKKTLDALAKFNPLMILRYSATHRTTHNKVHRLDALDAYNEKLVKKIEVRGIAVKGLAGTNAYLFLETIEISKQAPVARLEIEVRQRSGTIQRKIFRLKKGQDLFVMSNQLDQYRGFVIAQIDAFQNTVEFTNGHVLEVGEATGEVNEETVRRIQIRETIKAHFEKERQLFDQGIKVLSLFFIDQVAKYRDYTRPDERGDYARIFEEEYEQLKAEYLSELPLDSPAYRKYLDELPVARTHDGYFAIDKKTKRLKDPTVLSRGENAGLSDDVDAYDLILKDKERLLSFEEPIRFIFSHSALREGWDNPNVFVMCMLKHSDNTISRRQEVGRGLRLSVNRHGDRMDYPATVHDINVLTVVASESYKEFVANLQREISESLSARPRVADKAYFSGKILRAEQGSVVVTDDLAGMIEFYLIQNGYVDFKRRITEKYHCELKNDQLAAMPEELEPYAPQVIGLINGVFSEAQLPGAENGRKTKTNPLNGNFDKKAFKTLWNHINRKAVYQVEFESTELIRHSIRALDLDLEVSPLQYTIQSGQQVEKTTLEQLKDGKAFQVMETATEAGGSVHSMVKYDLLGKLSDNTQLTRKTLSEILGGIQKAVFKQFSQNPEHFIAEASRIINEQKASIIIERLTYDALADRYDSDIFTAAHSKLDFTNAGRKLKKHIYDYVITDSKVERAFVEELDSSKEVVVYAKLPRGFFIPTPVGDYNPDWAISFVEGKVKHIYFVAETKGSMSSLELRGVEQKKIECAHRFFEEINRKIDPEHVKYDVVDSFSKLMEIVGLASRTEYVGPTKFC